VLDARRCISYLTIEHQGAIPPELRPAIGTWVFGCDVCQEVCPFNAGEGETADARLRPRTPEHALPELLALATKGTNQMRGFVRRTAMRRVSREVLLRNVAVALGNTGAREAAPALTTLLAHPSPLVRGHAAWALGELGAVDELADHDDVDPGVRAEVTSARETAATRRTSPARRSGPA
jgi:epoxyqueuosine reductase